jgi:tRNA modification GTPase
MHAGDFSDTIVALATPQGIGALAVIRVSGNNALEITNRVFYGKDLTKPATHTVHVGTIRDGDSIIDEVVVALFRGQNHLPGKISLRLPVTVRCIL